MGINHESPTWPGHGPVLNERRAIFVYEAARLQADAMDASIVPPPWDMRETAFRAQFRTVIAMMCSDKRKTYPEELHNDWWRSYENMGWKYGPIRDAEAKTHPDMVPFGDLPFAEQIKDIVFIALCEIARQWIVDPEEELLNEVKLEPVNEVDDE